MCANFYDVEENDIKTFLGAREMSQIMIVSREFNSDLTLPARSDTGCVERGEDQTPVSDSTDMERAWATRVS